MFESSLQKDGDPRDLRFVSAPMSKLYVRMAAWLERPGAVSRVALIAFLLSLPAAATGLVGDDYWVEQRVGVDIWRGFDFFDPARNRALRDAGALPWWIDPRLRQSFLRPIASLTHALDFTLWPSSPAFMHVENSILYAALICVAGALYARLRLTPATFGLAALFYAANGNHGMTVGWLSGRNTLLAATFGLLALLCEVTALESAPRRALRVLALIAYGCALLSAEIGVSTGAYLVSYALTLRPGRLSQRLGQLWPYAAITIGWYVARDALGYGAEHSGFYHAPTQEPVLFLATLISGFPIYLATQLIGPLATFAGMYRHGMWIGALLSSALLWLMRGLFVPLVRADARARFLLLGAALSIVPLGSTMVQDRLVFFIGFGTAGLLSLLVSQRLDPANRNLPRTGAGILFFNHGLLLPVSFSSSLLSLAHVTLFGGGIDGLARALDEHADRPVVVVNVPYDLVSVFQDAVRTRRGREPLAGFDVLYSGLQPIELVRSGERSLEIDVAAGYLATPSERLLRDPTRNPFHVGDSVATARLRAQVLEINQDGAPTRIRFDFPAPLEQLPWLCWEGRAPQRCSPPAPNTHKHLSAISPF